MQNVCDMMQIETNLKHKSNIKVTNISKNELYSLFFCSFAVAIDGVLFMRIILTRVIYVYESSSGKLNV